MWSCCSLMLGYQGPLDLQCWVEWAHQQSPILYVSAAKISHLLPSSNIRRLVSSAVNNIRFLLFSLADLFSQMLRGQHLAQLLLILTGRRQSTPRVVSFLVVSCVLLGAWKQQAVKWPRRCQLVDYTAVKKWCRDRLVKKIFHILLRCVAAESYLFLVFITQFNVVVDASDAQMRPTLEESVEWRAYLLEE